MFSIAIRKKEQISGFFSNVPSNYFGDVQQQHHFLLSETKPEGDGGSAISGRVYDGSGGGSGGGTCGGYARGSGKVSG